MGGGGEGWGVGGHDRCKQRSFCENLKKGGRVGGGGGRVGGQGGCERRIEVFVKIQFFLFIFFFGGGGGGGSG